MSAALGLVAAKVALTVGECTAQPFDQALSQRVQHLTERSDMLTAQVIAARKSLPARRAAALDERYKVIEKRQGVEEAKRRQTEEEGAARRTHGGSSHPERELGW